jgi:3-oxoacyl-[acyl-carrier protein] reductase
MDLGIAGRTAIICASSRGLGKACATALAQAGCHVVINGRDAAVVQATADEIKAKTGAKATPVLADIATQDGQAALFKAAPEPDILVNNNAGPPPRDFRELTRQQMIDGVIANMIIAIELTQKAIGAMTAKKFGRIVNITSGTVKLPQAGLDLSSAARGGLTIFLAGVARTVASSNVTINNLLPGPFETDRLKAVLSAAAKRQNKSYEDMRAERIASIPARRLGDLEGFGSACAFLCSAQAGFITNQNIAIDGGAYPGVF